MAIFGFLQDGGRPPSWICDAHVCTTHEGHVVVFRLCKIWLELMRYSFDNMPVLMFCELGLKTTIHAPKIGVLGAKWGKGWCDVDPPNELVLTFGGCYLCANFGENQPRNATVRKAFRQFRRLGA